MKIKGMLPDLSKHTPDALTGIGVCAMVCTVAEYVNKSPEEHEKELYESLKKKYEEEA